MKRPSPPWLSICIAVKNRYKLYVGDQILWLFRNCVRSIQAAAYSFGESRPLELVVVDYCSDDVDLSRWLPKQVTPYLRVKYIRQEGFFSRGEGLNIAAAEASSDTLFLCDADIQVESGSLRIGVDHVRNGRAACPICLRTKKSGQMDFWENAGFGLVFVDKKTLFRVGGLPPFHSWGGEDCVLAHKLLEVKPISRYQDSGLRHQWHPESAKFKYYKNPRGYDMHHYQPRSS